MGYKTGLLNRVRIGIYSPYPLLFLILIIKICNHLLNSDLRGILLLYVVVK